MTRPPRLQAAAARFEAGLPGLRTGTHPPGGVLSIRDADGWTTHYTGSDFRSEGAGPLGPDSVWPVASLAKQFTAVATLRLLDRNGHSLGTAVGDLLPAWAGHRNLTVGHLLYHHSGLADDPAAAAGTAPDLAGASPLGEPGSDFHYANINYVLLASIVRVLANTSFRDAMTETVLVPAGLDQSVFDPGRRTVDGASWTSDGWRRETPQTSERGPAGLYMSLSELQTWHAALHDGRFGATVMERMNTAGRLADGRLGLYGGGQFVFRHQGIAYFCHMAQSGSIAGYLLRTRCPDTALIALTNSNCPNLGDLCWDLAPLAFARS